MVSYDNLLMCGGDMKYICKVCGYIYDDSKEKVPFKDLPGNWTCPLCGAPKSMFEPLEEKKDVKSTTKTTKSKVENVEKDDMKKLSNGMLSALCSNLARGCEKQYKFEEMELYQQLADYFESKVVEDKNASLDELIDLCKDDLNGGFKNADNLAKSVNDRGALRAKTWSEKVTVMLDSLLERYKKEGDKMLDGMNIWVCTICGFVYIGKELPEICPVCKVPNFKFELIKGRK